jgi:dTDP-4-dehydrorhamnose reductase
MRVLVTGSNGQLGTAVCLALRNFEVIPLTHKDIEITDMDSIMETCNRHKPDAIINTAAYVQVDDCETNADKAFQVNALGVRNMAVAAHELGAILIHISTDQVFGGIIDHKNNPYTEFDCPLPVNVYSRSKLAGENFVQHLCTRYFIVRTGALFGIAGSSGKGGNFVETMLRLAREKDEVKVVNDWVMSPAYAKDVATKITQLISTRYFGIFHIVNRGICSWYEFASKILQFAGLKTLVIPITSDQYPQKAKRPNFSALDNYHLRLLGMDDLRPWQDALKDYMKQKGHLK